MLISDMLFMVYPLSALMCALYLILSYWIAKYNIFFRRRVDKILSTQLTFSVFNLVKYQILSMLVINLLRVTIWGQNPNLRLLLRTSSHAARPLRPHTAFFRFHFI